MARGAQTPDLYAREEQARAGGCRLVVGIDEAGRGPLAGPLVVAGVALPPDWRLPGLNDSKQVRPAARERLAAALCSTAGVAWRLAVVPVAEIDARNIYQATCEAMRQVARDFAPTPDLVLLDGLPVRDFPVPCASVVGGDASCACIAAASILAKVHRDRLMVTLDAAYPQYGFARHKGYATAAHLAALRRHGPCPEHRRSFAPVAAALAPDPQGRLWPDAP